MKNFFSLFIALTSSIGMMAGGLVPYGDDEINSVLIDGLYYVLDGANKTAEVAYHKRHDKDDHEYSHLTEVKVPERVTFADVEYRVTSVGNGAFHRCYNLTSIELPDAITTIGESAFEGAGLTSFFMPKNLTTIKNYAFEYCGDLVKVIWSKSIQTIGKEAFWNICINHKDFPGGIFIDDLDYWCRQPFEGDNVLGWLHRLYLNNEEITELVIPETVTDIAPQAFATAINIRSVKFHNKLQTIGDRAFYECRALQALTLPQSLQRIGIAAFDNCVNIANPLIIPGGIKRIEESAFYGCKNITSVSMSNGVLSIGKNAFRSCGNLTSITLPHSVQTIEDGAFYGCWQVTRIVLGNDLTYIGQNAFQDLKKVKDLYCYAAQVPLIDTKDMADTFFFELSTKTNVWVLSDLISEYKKARIWQDMKNLNPIGASSSSVTRATAKPSSNSVEIKWPAVSGADLYGIDIITADKEVVCMLTFDSSGQLKQVYLAPSRHPQQAPEQTQASGFAFTVYGLDPGQTYTYYIDAFDSNGKMLDEKEGSFTTTGDSQDINNVPQNNVPCTKILKNGQIYLINDETIHTVQGARIK